MSLRPYAEWLLTVAESPTVLVRLPTARVVGLVGFLVSFAWTFKAWLPTVIGCKRVNYQFNFSSCFPVEILLVEFLRSTVSHCKVVIKRFHKSGVMVYSPSGLFFFFLSFFRKREREREKDKNLEFCALISSDCIMKSGRCQSLLSQTYPYWQGFRTVIGITECNKATFWYGFAIWGTAFVIQCSGHHFTIAVTEQVLSCAYKISCR